MKKLGGIPGMAFLTLSLFASAAFATSDDGIFSQHIKEADGMTGQSTDSGSGIKTGHIQDGAVTANKVAAGAVGADKIADSAVTTGKMADSSVTTVKIADQSVTAQKISDGAVTDVKISGMIPADKISSLPQSQIIGLEGALADKADGTHNHDSVYRKKYGKVAVVAQSGGDYADPVAAMEDAAAWCGTPSETNPCQLKIMPGVYQISSSLRMKPYIDIEGSGETVTRIVGNGLQTATGTGACEGSGVVIGGVAAEIRSLTIENSEGGAQVNVGYYACRWFFGHTQKLTNLTIAASGGAYNYAIFNNSDSPIITNVTVSATGSGVNHGIYNLGGAAVMRDLVVTGTMTNIVGCSGCETVRCLGVYDANYDPIPCP